jgi:AraC-like DNA-binding protein
LSKTRQTGGDGQVCVRTFPVTFLHDHTQAFHTPAWHQLIFAARGNLEVITDASRWLVPADRAVWLPARTRFTAVMRAPISMRSIYVAAATMREARRVRTIAVAPLLRELILHVTRLGALDRADAEQARLAGVLVDLLRGAADVPLELPSPRDPRARRFAQLVADHPSEPTAALVGKSGASLRTLERCFATETGMALGDWRRRVRLFHALHRLQAGASVTEVALDVGYATPSAFSQAFQRAMGRSPSELARARLRG